MGRSCVRSGRPEKSEMGRYGLIQRSVPLRRQCADDDSDPLRAESDSRVAWKDKRTAARSDEFLPYQLSTVVQCTPVAFTGDGELGFDSGEGA